MSVVKHPTLPVSREVEDPARWVAAGWVEDKPEPTPEPESEQVEDEPDEAPPKRRKR